MWYRFTFPCSTLRYVELLGYKAGALFWASGSYLLVSARPVVGIIEKVKNMNILDGWLLQSAREAKCVSDRRYQSGGGTNGLVN